jgi:KDO2-lipid IV(A) lauroyltransferase
LVKVNLILFLRLFSRLPLPIAHGIGTVMGLLALLRGRHRSVVKKQMQLTGLYSPHQLLRTGIELGKGMAEFPWVWLAPLPKVFKRVREVRGWEHIEAAQKNGAAIVLLAPHLGCWEICGMFVAQRLSFTALYSPPKQEWVHEIMRDGRERAGLKTVPPTTSGVRALLGRLKKGEATFILPDHVASKGEGQWMRFLGHPVYMPTLPYRLISSTHAVSLVVFAERLSWGRGFRLHIEPAPAAPDNSPDTLAHVTNQALSDLIRRYPTQYLWSYRLFNRQRGVPVP